jgi:hypothetical protein
MRSWRASRALPQPSPGDRRPMKKDAHYFPRPQILQTAKISLKRLDLIRKKEQPPKRQQQSKRQTSCERGAQSHGTL